MRFSRARPVFCDILCIKQIVWNLGFDRDEGRFFGDSFTVNWQVDNLNLGRVYVGAMLGLGPLKESRGLLYSMHMNT